MFENRKALHSKQFCLCACQSFDSQFCWNAGQGLKRKCKKMITPSPSCVWYRLLTVHLVLFFIHPGFLGRGCTMWAYFVCLISINTLRGFSKLLTAISAPSLFLVPSYTLTETEKEDFNSAVMTISQRTALKPGINFQVHLHPKQAIHQRPPAAQQLLLCSLDLLHGSLWRHLFYLWHHLPSVVGFRVFSQPMTLILFFF